MIVTSLIHAQPAVRPPAGANAELNDEWPSIREYPHFPYLIKNPGPEYADSVRMFQGIPSVVVT